MDWIYWWECMYRYLLDLRKLTVSTKILLKFQLYVIELQKYSMFSNYFLVTCLVTFIHLQVLQNHSEMFCLLFCCLLCHYFYSSSCFYSFSVQCTEYTLMLCRELRCYASLLEQCDIWQSLSHKYHFQFWTDFLWIEISCLKGEYCNHSMCFISLVITCWPLTGRRFLQITCVVSSSSLRCRSHSVSLSCEHIIYEREETH